MVELPSDLIFCIADHLDVDTIWRGLRVTCKRFYKLFEQPNYWNCRLRKKRVVLPIRHFDCGSTRLAKFASKFESEWTKLNNFNYEPNFVQGHFGTADAIRLISDGSYCVSGARNSSLSFWNLSNDEMIEKIQEVKQAHLGWIWSLNEHSNGVVLSAGFDNFLKEWHLLNGEVKLADEICLGSPVLWSRSTDEMVLVGTCNSKITVLDQRDWSTKIRTLTYSRQPIIDAVVPKNSPFFFTLSEEGVSVVDIRMWSKFKEFKWKTPCHAIAKCHELLYVARSVNNRQDTRVHLIDTKILEPLNASEFQVDGSSKCRLSATESTIACLSNNLTVYLGGVKPKSIWSYNENLSNYINLDYTNGRIALTSTDGKISCFY